MTVDALPDSAAQKTVLDGQIFNVHCASSSDFTVGRQTNFHAPVTIINCPTAKADQVPDGIVLRDTVWPQNGVKVLQSQINSSSIELVRQNDGGKKENSLNGKLQKHVKSIFLGMPVYAWIIIFAVILSCIIAIIAIIPHKNSVISVNKPPSGSEKILIGNTSNYYYPKEAWGGLNASSKIEIITPTPYVVISHTASRFCYEPTTCQDVVRGIQKYHMSQTPAFADIGYNFLIGGDGNIYEGRGWGIRSPNEGIVNNKNIGIALLGDFSVYDDPTQIQVNGLKELLAWGVRDCWLSPEYILVAHSAIVATLSPGKNVMKIISTWDHFEPNPKENLTRLASATNFTCHHQPPNSFLYRVIGLTNSNS